MEQLILDRWQALSDCFFNPENILEFFKVCVHDPVCISVLVWLSAVAVFIMFSRLIKLFIERG